MLLQRSNQNPLKMMPKSIKIHPKFIQNLSKWCPGALRKRPWQQVCSRCPKKALRLFINLRFLPPLGRFWVPFWSQLGAKGVPKSSSLASGCTKKSKNEVPERVPEKALNFDRNFDGKCVQMPRTIDFTAVLQCYFNIHDFRKSFQNHRKSVPKRVPK